MVNKRRLIIALLFLLKVKSILLLYGWLDLYDIHDMST
jgi:hypothetical protein